ncbi:glycine oxidase ThiO [Propionibacteriaceae bacterium Y1685]
MSSPEVLVVGGGLIGLSIARGLARRGTSVAMVSDEQPHAASGVAAGMLAPVTEADPTEGRLQQLNVASLQLWDEFATQLEHDAGLPVGLRRTATLSVGFNADDARRLADFGDFLASAGMAAEFRTSRECRSAVPLLAPQVRSGLWVPGDWSVDNRLLWAALRADAVRAGVELITGRVSELIITDDTCHGVRLADGSAHRAPTTVLAAGAWSGQLPLPFELPVRPIKGQVLRLKSHGLPIPDCTVRAFSQGFEVYVVPRTSGEVVVGATTEDRGFEDFPTAGGTYELLRDARSILPIITEYELAEISVGYRPCPPDNAPLLGPTPVEGLIVATGHHRNGVLLTPITAHMITELIVTGALPAAARPFNPWVSAHPAAPTLGTGTDHDSERLEPR